MPARTRQSLAAVLLLCLIGAQARAYVIEKQPDGTPVPFWPNGTVPMQLQLDTTPLTSPLSDGSTSWGEVAQASLTDWNSHMAKVQFAGVANSTAPIAQNNNYNNVFFSGTVYGEAWPSGVVGQTLYEWNQTVRIEADVVFNSGVTFDSYRGDLKYQSNGQPINDFKRVSLHEFGHALCLDHPDTNGQTVAAIMNSVASNTDDLTADDIAGVQFAYGAPATSTPGTSRLINVSSRALVGTGQNVLIPGFVITGPSGTTKQVLIRASGPALTQFGVTGVLANPVLSLSNNSGTVIASNTGWSTSPNASQLAAVASAAGAFAFPANSPDSAILTSLAPGAYTFNISGANGGTGIALAELYEVNTEDPSVLINISARINVGTGANTLIAGFVIKGTQPAHLLIRGDGPVLAQFNVSGSLAQPVLTIFDGNGNQVATNTGWGTNANASAIASAASTAGAFALPSNSADSALLLSLAPGAYTAQVAGANNSTGVALVEVYQVP